MAYDDDQAESSDRDAWADDLLGLAPPAPADNAAVALDLARRGFAVFPILRRDSGDWTPVTGWPQRATADPEQVAAWWRQHPGARVGLPCGPVNGCAVIDVDVKHGKDGLASLAALGLSLDSSPVRVRTPSGGWHLFFEPDPRLRNWVGKLGDGLDVRTAGGYVVAPGSLKGEARYEPMGEPLGAVTLPPWPAAAIPADLPPERGPVAAIDPAAITPELRAAAAERLARWAEELEAEPVGSRNDMLNKAAMWCGGAAAHGLLARGEAEAALLPAVPDLGRAAPKTFKSGFTAGLRKPIDLTPLGGAALDLDDLDDLPDAPAAPAPATTDDSDPTDLWGILPPPPLPPGALPAPIESFARTMGETQGADPAGFAMAALAACAAAIPDGIRLKMKPHESWTESARLWVALVGLPSTKKSPIVRAATRQLYKIDREEGDRFQRRLDEWESLPKESRGPKPLCREVVLGDSTVEAAQEALRGSKEGVLNLRDELHGFFASMERYGSNSDRAFWLESFNGGPYKVNRIARGRFTIPNLSVSILGGIQPDKIRAVDLEGSDDGLMQRFLPVILRPATRDTDAPMPDAAGDFDCLVRDLYRSWVIGGADAGPLRFSAEAQEVFADVREGLFVMQGIEAIDPKLASHYAKLEGIFGRMCVVWHCVEHAGVGMPTTVSADTARRVAHFIDAFIKPHSYLLYKDVLGGSAHDKKVVALASWLLRNGRREASARDVQRAQVGGLLTTRETEPVLETLHAHGWLIRVPPSKPGAGHRWRVNPRVHELFAGRKATEEARLAAARKAIEASVGRR